MRSRIARLGPVVATIFALSACGEPTAPAALASNNAATVSAKKMQFSPLTRPVTGTIASIGGAFAGTYTVTSFANQGGQLVAIGTLTGTLTDALGNVIGTVTDLPLTLPVTNLTGSCQILHLELGPLDLDLLGLQVHLDKVVLDITAQSGPGNLLGNLLCGIAGLLDGSQPLNQLVNLLNQLLALF
jgi:hypothetical protein